MFTSLIFKVDPLVTVNPSIPWKSIVDLFEPDVTPFTFIVPLAVVPGDSVTL